MSLKEWIPDDQPDFNRFYQSPTWKAPEVPLGDGRIHVREYTCARRHPTSKVRCPKDSPKEFLTKRTGMLFTGLRRFTMILTLPTISLHHALGPSSSLAAVLRFLSRFSPLSPALRPRFPMRATPKSNFQALHYSQPTL